MHRVLWDMHYTPLAATAGAAARYPMQAIAHDTAALHHFASGPRPGSTPSKLTANGKSYTQPLTLKMDPRVKTPPLGLQQQFTLSKQLYDDALESAKTLDQVRAVRAQVEARGRAPGPAAEALGAFDKKAAALEAAAAAAAAGAERCNPAHLPSARLPPDSPP